MWRAGIRTAWGLRSSFCLLASWLLTVFSACGNDERVIRVFDDVDSADTELADGSGQNDTTDADTDDRDGREDEGASADSAADLDSDPTEDAGGADTFEPDQPVGSDCAEASHCEQGLHCSQGVCTPIGSVFIPPGEAILGSEDDSFDCPYDPETGRACRGAGGVSLSWYPTRFRFTYGLFMDATEVTYAQWYDEAMWTAAGFEPPTVPALTNDHYPVADIPIESAMAWTNVRSRAEGLQECYVLQDCRIDIDSVQPVRRVASWDELPADLLVAPGFRSVVADEVPFTPFSPLHCGTIDFYGWDCTGYRLPTEFEWEYAARAGTYGNYVYRTAETEGIVNEAPFPEFGREREWCNLELPSHEVFNAIAWWGCNAEHEQPVGLKAPNARGLFDMVGNASEWLHVNRSRSPEMGGNNANLDELNERLVQTDGVYVDPMRFERDDPRLVDGEDVQRSSYYYARPGSLADRDLWLKGYVGIFARGGIEHLPERKSDGPGDIGFRTVRRLFEP